MGMKLFFMGTGPFAVPSLEALAKAGHEILLVVSQPDRPKGRGQHLQPTPVKEAALKLGLPVFQPEQVKRPEAVEKLAGLGAEAGCVVAFGQILPQSLLDAPRLGCVNVHASLLPKYRGAAPVPWALAAGETETGVSTQRMVAKLDAGPVLLQEKIAIQPGEDSPALLERLAPLGARLLVQTLEGLRQGSLQPRPQDEAQASLAPLIKKADGAADFNLGAGDLERRCRAFRPWPGLHARLGEGGAVLRLHQLAPGPAAQGKPGEILAVQEEGWKAACGLGQSLWIQEVQPAGGRVMKASEYARGHRVSAGTILLPAV